jgi:hypothetical protein
MLRGLQAELDQAADGPRARKLEGMPAIAFSLAVSVAASFRDPLKTSRTVSCPGDVLSIAHMGPGGNSKIFNEAINGHLQIRHASGIVPFPVPFRNRRAAGPSPNRRAPVQRTRLPSGDPWATTTAGQKINSRCDPLFRISAAQGQPDRGDRPLSDTPRNYL